MPSIHSSVSTSLGGALPVDAGHPEIRIVLGVLRHFRERGGFEPQIHFERYRTAQRRRGLDQPQPLRLGGILLGIAGGKGEGVLIELEAALDARPQDLHRDRLAGRRRSSPRRDGPARSMRRPPPGRSLRNVSLQRPAESAARPRPPLVPAETAAIRSCRLSRSRAIAAPDNIGPGCQELPELHIGRPEPGQRRRQAAGLAVARRAFDQPREPQSRSARAAAAARDRPKPARPRARTRNSRGRDAGDGRADDIMRASDAASRLTAASRNASATSRRKSAGARRGQSRRRGSCR